jgi:hypothetical protein
MAGPLIKTKYVAIASIAVLVVFVVAVLVPLAIVFSWVAMLLSFAGITNWPAPPTVNTLTTYFLISFAAVCASLWLASQVGIIALKPSAQKLIGRAFVATALGAIATSFTKILLGK